MSSISDKEAMPVDKITGFLSAATLLIKGISLNSNEEIVTNGAFTVDASAQLQGKKSMMNTVTL